MHIPEEDASTLLLASCSAMLELPFELKAPLPSNCFEKSFTGTGGESSSSESHQESRFDFIVNMVGVKNERREMIGGNLIKWNRFFFNHNRLLLRIRVSLSIDISQVRFNIMAKRNSKQAQRGLFVQFINCLCRN